MRKNFRLTSALILLSLFSSIGGLCNGMVASAATIAKQNKIEASSVDASLVFNISKSPIHEKMAALDEKNCVEEHNDPVVGVQVKKELPSKNSIAPCCLEKPEKSPSKIPNSPDGKDKLSATALDSALVFEATHSVNKNNYDSSPAPPEPDILSSVIKKE